MYIIITIVAFIILIIGSIYGWYKAYVKEELKITKLEESHKETVKSLMGLNNKFQQRIIELEKRIIELENYKKLRITLDDDDND